jgi:uncharacterized surface protein with fasciclin (FAS1) repeats
MPSTRNGQTTRNGQNELGDLVDVAGKDGTFSKFLAAAAAADMISVLRAAGPYTLFAPTDKAFAKFPASTLAKLMRPNHRGLLASIVGYHMALGAVRSQSLAGKRYRAKTYEGRDLRIDGRGDVVAVNGAPLVRPDLRASNGVLHGIDHVLWPKPSQERTSAPDQNG